MTTKMTRRTFLKGAAAAAAAVSLSGLLTGCGGDQLADNEVQIGAYTVKVYGLDVDQGTEMNKAGAILGKVKLKFADGGGNWQTMRYDGMFSAAVNGCTLTQVAPTGRFTVTIPWVESCTALWNRSCGSASPTRVGVTSTRTVQWQC